MKLKSALLIATLFVLLGTGTAKAQEEPDMDGGCPEGKVPVTFADGNTATTMCVEPGSEMEATEESELEGVIDPGNYD